MPIVFFVFLNNQNGSSAPEYPTRFLIQPNFFGPKANVYPQNEENCFLGVEGWGFIVQGIKNGGFEDHWYQISNSIPIYVVKFKFFN